MELSAVILRNMWETDRRLGLKEHEPFRDARLTAISKLPLGCEISKK